MNDVSGNISYDFVRSPRARSMSITVYRTGAVRVTVPRFTPQFLADRFVYSKKEWISRKVEYFLKHPKVESDSDLHKTGRRHFLAHKEAARNLVTERIAHFNAHYNFSFKRIAIRDQKSRWGSCSRTGNLNFNYRIVFLPPELQDYIVVHELCHIGRFDHSRAFWDLVGECIPDPKEARKKLRKLSLRG